ILLSQNTAVVTGLVSDPVGAAVANAPVQLKNVSTGAIYNATSNSSGLFTVAGLPPGDYELTVAVPGFKKYTTTVTVSVNQRVRQDVSLAIGSAGESVTVLSQAVPLQMDAVGKAMGQASYMAPPPLPFQVRQIVVPRRAFGIRIPGAPGNTEQYDSFV